MLTDCPSLQLALPSGTIPFSPQLFRDYGGTGLTTSDLANRRLARRGGVLRIQKEIYDEVRKVLRDRLAEVCGKSRSIAYSLSL
jgi:hypothetical protein